MTSVLLDYSNLTEKKLIEVKETYITQNQKINDKISMLSDNELNWKNVFDETIHFNNTFVDKAYLNMKDFYTVESIRELCSDLSSELSKFDIEQAMRKDVYQKIKYYYENKYPQEFCNLDEEQISYIEDIIINYKMLGLDLSDDKYERVKEIKKELSELSNDFSLNLSNEKSKFELTLDELNGLPEDYLKERINEKGTYTISLKYPDVIPLMENCKNRLTRRKMGTEFKRRCINENTPIAEKAFALRKELASIFGFKNFSDYKLQNKMAKTTDTVNKFLSDLVEKMKPKLESDLKSLLKLAYEDAIDKLEHYDIAYFSRIYTDNNSGLNKEDLKKHFPVDKVVSGT